MAVMQEQSSDQPGNDELRPREGRVGSHHVLPTVGSALIFTVPALEVQPTAFDIGDHGSNM